MRRIPVILALVTFVFASAVYACSCGRGPIEQFFWDSRDVGIATVTGLELQEFGSIVVFDVEKSWKGTPAGTPLHAWSSQMPSACGREYRVGDRLLIFTHMEGSQVTADGMCSYVGTVDAARKEVALLNKWAWWWRKPISKWLHRNE